jgi:hypothetical protein
VGAAVDALRGVIVSWYINGQRVAGEHLDAVGLNQHVDHERTPGLALAIRAVAAMREQRLVRQAVADRAAGTAALASDAHRR